MAYVVILWYMYIITKDLLPNQLTRTATSCRSFYYVVQDFLHGQLFLPSLGETTLIPKVGICGMSEKINGNIK